MLPSTASVYSATPPKAAEDGAAARFAHDLSLVRNAVAGRPDAQRELAARLLDAVHREVARSLLRLATAARRDPRQDVADLVQDVLVALFERDAQELRRWDPTRGRSLESFVALVARRRVARILSQRRGNPWADSPIDPVDADGLADSHGLRRAQGREALGAMLEQLHARMSVRDHELFELLFNRELDPDDVARRMQMTRGAVNAWTYRLRKLARSIAAVSSTGDSPTRLKATHDG